MSNTIKPSAGPAGPAGVSGESPSNNSGPADPNLINTLTLQLALLKRTPGMPPKVIEALENQLDALKHGFSSAAEAKKAFDDAVDEAVDKGMTQASYTIINIAANEVAKLQQNEVLEQLKKDGEDKDNN